MLQDIKLDIETKFYDHWSDTKVHYGGEEFDNKGLDKWVNVIYTPTLMHKSGLSSTKTNTYNVNVYMVCWAKDDIMGSSLVDTITTFTDEQFFSVLQSDIEIVDRGWDESNMVYYLLRFNYQYPCVTPPKNP